MTREMAKRKTKKISVQTLPNGYALTVNSKQYMLFSEKELVAAVFYHILLGKEEYVNKNISENLMVAAATWPTVGEAIQGNATLMADVKEARREARVSRMQNNRLNERLDALQSELNDLKVNYNKAKIKVERYDNIKLRYDTIYDMYNNEKENNFQLQKEINRLRRLEATNNTSSKKKKNIKPKTKEL